MGILWRAGLAGFSSDSRGLGIGCKSLSSHAYPVQKAQLNMGSLEILALVPVLVDTQATFQK